MDSIWTAKSRILFQILRGNEILFKDVPEAIVNIQEVVDKIEPFELARDVLLPKFDIPQEFVEPRWMKPDGGNLGENAYLKHLTY